MISWGARSASLEPMIRKRHTDEGIIKKVREAAGLMAGGKAAGAAARQIVGAGRTTTGGRSNVEHLTATWSIVPRVWRENCRPKYLLADHTPYNALL
jgi:putative transposase